ncbi:S8 family peptidase [Aneurinibacillus sp. Ricciae_BoGa-3]|uniref:S8 family peptidase n=1 Tax=Aneurinibacillus sp. Ricciae_BoGa-3 TaxID=3022697 RepID=UPI0023403183|nr:S8 family peptidase [Aneurinibacillus sp. Ricciae_BoGa-3]WCK53382.1 S8 family peptidase [Aneurinibacillus sp. Ricciae_BoGa-3]
MRNPLKYAALALVAAVLLFLVSPLALHRTGSQKPGTTVTEQMPNPHQSGPRLLQLDNIGKGKQARTRLDNSTHIVTIHHNSNNKSHYMKNEVTVKFKRQPTDGELQKILHEVNGQVKNRHNSTYVIKSANHSSHWLIDHFSQRTDVAYAEPNYLLLHRTVPNDEYYSRYQWDMPMVDMEHAWDITQGKANVVVATVDTGIDYQHPEFAGKIAGGYNVLDESSPPQDDNGHGTHVAGIIGALANNNQGIAGISWNSKIMPVKGIGADGSGSSLDIAKGIVWAADHGASVINMSIGNYHPSSALHEAIRYAYGKDVVLVAASGNDNTSQPSYPAAYPEVLSVGAADSAGKRATFSNYGAYLDIVAPGVEIPSTYVGSQYAALSGTSMACPHVAGAAALIRSVNPTLTNSEVMNILRTSADDYGSPGWDHYFGYGLMNVSRALQMAEPRQKSAAPPRMIPGSFFEQLTEQFRNLFR